MTLRRPYAWQQKTSRNADAVASWLSTSVATKDIVVSATTQALPKSHVKEEKWGTRSGAYLPPHLRNK